MLSHKPSFTVADYFIMNPFNLDYENVTHSVVLEIRDCQCNRTTVTVLLDRDQIDDSELDDAFPYHSIRAFGYVKPFSF